MNTTFVILAALLAVSACRGPAAGPAHTVEVSSMNDNASFADRLRHYQAKNPEEEANKAAKQGNYYLMGTADRGGVKAPGIEAAQLEQVKSQCPVKVTHGMGDTIKGKDHMSYMRFMHTYITRFNQAMLSHCVSG